MRKVLFIFALVAGGLFSSSLQAQEVVKLNQTNGNFTQQELNLKAGETYVFEVTNSGVDHEVGFVVAPKGQTEREHHIAEAYLTKTITDGEMAASQEVTLEAGEYVYFCPLNPTPQYILTVE